jgi:ATP-dependent Clp protease ATP-binding subunit ClpC
MNTTILEKYGCIDLCKLAEEGKFDPLIGRLPQIERALIILNQRKKNCPVFTGEPGVGKTQLGLGLAQRLLDGDVPSKLIGKRLVQFNPTWIVAGTVYRGQFEERMREFLKEVLSDGKIILFIDELHTIMGAGAGSDSSMDVSNIMKPALASGKLSVVGATTIGEYRKKIELDGAMSRRFQQVDVPPSTPEETLLIMTNLRAIYEEHHQVRFSDAIVKRMVYLANRYGEVALPDEAVTLMDRVGSAVQLRVSGTFPEVASLRQLITAKTVEVANAKHESKVEDATRLEAELNAIKLQLRNTLAAAKEQAKTQAATDVTDEDIVKVFQSFSPVPISKADEEETSELLGMEKIIEKSLIGQKQAVTAVCDAIRRIRAGFENVSGPQASFIFLGPTGVGKTQLCRSLAEFLFGSPESLVQIDGSEYGDKFNASRLIGAPPGYVGYEEAGQLTEAVRRKKYCIVLFDEIEKMHADVRNLLLQILEDGYLTDSQGRRVDFRNTIIMITSNIGAKNLSKKARGSALDLNRDESDGGLSLQVIRNDVLRDVEKVLTPELIGRMDEIVVFDRLTLEEIRSLIVTKSKRVFEVAEKNGIELDFTDEAKQFVIDNGGFDAKYGARPLKHTITRLVESAFSKHLLNKTFASGSKVRIVVKATKDAKETKDGGKELDFVLAENEGVTEHKAA